MHPLLHIASDATGSHTLCIVEGLVNCIYCFRSFCNNETYLIVISMVNKMDEAVSVVVKELGCVELKDKQ